MDPLAGSIAVTVKGALNRKSINMLSKKTGLVNTKGAHCRPQMGSGSFSMFRESLVGERAHSGARQAQAGLARPMDRANDQAHRKAGTRSCLPVMRALLGDTGTLIRWLA